MGGRFLVTGTQLGILSAIDDKCVRNKTIQNIIDKQYIRASSTSIMDDIKELTQPKHTKPLKHQKIEFISTTYPEIDINNFCTCREPTKREICVALKIIATIPKDEFGDFAQMLVNAEKFEGTDIPIKITLESLRE